MVDLDIKRGEGKGKGRKGRKGRKVKGVKGEVKGVKEGVNLLVMMVVVGKRGGKLEGGNGVFVLG